MRVGVLTLLALSALHGADPERQAVVQKAKWAFDRAILSAQPEVGEISDCIQAEAALLPVALPSELPVVQYRKGFCQLMSAAITQNAAAFREAATAFDQAKSTWPNRTKQAKGKPPEQGPSVLMVLSSIARLEAAGDQTPTAQASGSTTSVGMQEDLSIGVARGTCSSELMTPSACQGVFRAGHEWAGWMSLERGDIPEAARSLANLPDSFWTHWVAGKQAFAAEKYMNAAVQYGAAIELWKNVQARWRANWMARLGPKPRLGIALTDLGGARMLAGEIQSAIATFDSAIAANPQYARAIYLRARAKELAGQQDAATADYSLAARTAYAGAEDLVSGEGHLYRGIQAYRRKDFARAEDEFEGALNSTDLSKELRRDATAWRLLAAVTGGACGASRGLLAEALASVSPYFPRADARAAMLACPDTF